MEILNRDELPKIGKNINWKEVKKGFIFKTQHKKHGYNEFEFIREEGKKIHLIHDGHEVYILKSSFVTGTISGIIKHCAQIKNDVFEVLNAEEIPLNCKGEIGWISIPKGFIFKTRHAKWGYREFEFVAVDGGDMTLIYDGKESKIKIGSFVKGEVSVAVGAMSFEHRYKVGQEKNCFVITELCRNKNKDRAYKIKCTKCGFDGSGYYTQQGEWKEEYLISEGDLRRGGGCPCCANVAIVPDINSIWATDRWMCDLGLSKEEAEKYTHGKNKKINIICPDCGAQKNNVKILDIYKNKSIGCKCGDGFSYPEKVMSSILDQLNIDYETQATFEWSDRKRYDFYVPSKNMIIETHGSQHYEETRRKNGRTLKEEQENDRFKKDISLLNGIEKYIVIDCRKSNLEFIKSAIESSELCYELDLASVNWLFCEEYALKNIVKSVCDYWVVKSDKEGVTEVSAKFGISVSATRGYLKKGTKLGWCNYSRQEEIKKKVLRCKKVKPVNVFKDGEFIGRYASIYSLQNISYKELGVKLDKGGITKVCKGKISIYKGFTFEYAKKEEE